MLTIAIIVNAIARNFSRVDPHIGFQVWVVSLDAGVDDADRNVVAA